MPLASALREAALHVLADCAPDLQAVDVQAAMRPRPAWPTHGPRWRAALAARAC
jgi:hypothetical protein